METGGLSPQSHGTVCSAGQVEGTHTEQAVGPGKPTGQPFLGALSSFSFILYVVLTLERAGPGQLEAPRLELGQLAFFQGSWC